VLQPKKKDITLLQDSMLLLEQKALHAMMNPHFFNALGSIQNYILKSKATKRTHSCKQA